MSQIPSSYHSLNGNADLHNNINNAYTTNPPSPFTTNNPSSPFRISLWNANGLGTTVIHDVLSHCASTDVLFITETWLLHPTRLPTDWDQYHLYGTPVQSTFRGLMGVACLVSPECKLPVTQLPSPNNYTLLMKIGALHVLCLYLPPSLSQSAVDSILSALPIHYPNEQCILVNKIKS